MDEKDRIAILQQFGRTYRAFMAAFETHVGHPLVRWRILFALYEHDGRRSQKQLVEHLRMDPGALTRQLKSIEALDLITRASDERDNRITNVSLTPAGAALVEDSLPRRTAFLNETMASLPDAALRAFAGGLQLLEAQIARVTAAKE